MPTSKTCETCGTSFDASGLTIRPDLCFDCFRQRINTLCAEIDQAARVGPGTVTAVYLTGMADLGADAESLRADVALADLAGGGQ